MDFKAISTAPWWAKKYIFTSLVAANRIEVSIVFRKGTNTAPPFLIKIGCDALPPLITWNNGCSGLNIIRLDSVGRYSPLLFNRVIDKLVV